MEKLSRSLLLLLILSMLLPVSSLASPNVYAPGTFNYFAYGPNMEAGRLQRIVSSQAVFLDIVRVNNYKFVIDHSNSNGTGTSDVVSSTGDYVQGVLWQIPLSQQTALDIAEGVPTAYQRNDNFKVISMTTGFTTVASVYTVVSPVSPAPAPDSFFITYVRAGIVQHSVGLQYLNKINAILTPATATPPGIWATNVVTILMENEGLEDATLSGTCSFNPPRGGDHFPFLDFTDMITTARCANFLTTVSASNDQEFVDALATTATNYVWLTPNDCNNMHGVSGNPSPCTNHCTTVPANDTCIADVDTYIANLVQKILSSTMFTTAYSALFVLFDEGGNFCPTSPSGAGPLGDCVPFIAAGPAVKAAYQTTSNFNHYGYLVTLEQNFQASCLVKRTTAVQTCSARSSRRRPETSTQAGTSTTVRPQVRTAQAAQSPFRPRAFYQQMNTFQAEIATASAFALLRRECFPSHPTVLVALSPQHQALASLAL